MLGIVEIEMDKNIGKSMDTQALYGFIRIQASQTWGSSKCKLALYNPSRGY